MIVSLVGVRFWIAIDNAFVASTAV